ncbi:MAG: DHA2 family efflux MFS transporter permease subunit [Xanthobacteraceae bacterium]
MMCIGMFMAILDVQVVATSLPTIQRALNIAQDQMSWVQTSYLIAEIIAIPLTGCLTRAFTMRWRFVIAVSAFTLASIACVLSDSFETLILWRVVQGFSGGTLIPTVFSAVFLMFPLRLQSVATTIAGVLAVLAPTVGPVVGGWLTETYSWHWLFLINVLPGVMAAAVACVSLPKEKLNLAQARHLDVPALLLMACALAALEIGIKAAPQPVSVLTGAIFIWRMIRSPHPLVDTRAFRDRNFAVGCLLSFATGIGLFGSVYLMPVFLSYVRGHDPFEVGKIILVTGVVQFVAAPIAVAVDERFDERYVAAFGILLFGVGMAMSCVQTSATDYDAMFWPQIVRGAAVMFCILPSTRLALAHIAKTKIPDASGLFNLMRNLGGAIGIAIIDTIIYTRAPIHARSLADRLAAGDIEAAKTLGIPLDLIARSFVEPAARAAVAPLIDKMAFVEAINDAWALVAVLTLAVLVAMPLARTPIWRLMVSIRKGRVQVRHQR